MTVSGTRPAIHWDATFTESLSSNSITQGPGTPRGRKLHGREHGHRRRPLLSFHRDDPPQPGIRQYHTGTEFCPADPTTRQEMAVFLLKASQGASFPTPACVGIFTDVACTPGTGFPDWIENLYNRGITAGCQLPGDPLEYCPTRDVLRSEMAVFLLKSSFGSSYTPAPCSGIFSDVPCTPGVGFPDWIEDLYGRGITAGCQAPGDPLKYCPDDRVLRREMAVFLVKSFGLQLYGP